MKYVWVIAFLLLILIGFEAAANFVSFILVGGMILLLVGAVFMAVSALFKMKFWEAFKWFAATAFWGWILSICF